MLKGLNYSTTEPFPHYLKTKFLNEGRREEEGGNGGLDMIKACDTHARKCHKETQYYVQ